MCYPGQFDPSRDIWQGLETFLVFNTGGWEGGTISMLQVESGDAAEQLAMSKNYLAPNANNADFQKSCDSGSWGSGGRM